MSEEAATIELIVRGGEKTAGLGKTILPVQPEFVQSLGGALRCPLPTVPLDVRQWHLERL